ncbi:MAG TPA: glycosyl hydrolase, partial [Stellaceae bacterium]|nr:glycosyl hydrolase [Stellaceae bacterium]
MPTSTRVPAPANLGGLKWRCIGPPRGGRVVAVAGDPADKAVAYFGACAGGIWKTIDGGVYWRCVSDGFMGSAAVGAIAVAPSDSNVIYAGSGETTIRIDVSYGDGVYKSIDAGRTWSHVGLKASKHIGRIAIHPRDPDIAFVAALGDIFGPHEERGVFRTTDGGKSWTKVLYRDADTGAVDISLDPNNP